MKNRDKNSKWKTKISMGLTDSNFVESRLFQSAIESLSLILPIIAIISTRGIRSDAKISPAPGRSP